MLPPETPTSLYRYYDSFGVLLYVGITSRGASRNHEHNASKDWWQYVSRQDVEHFPTREAALTAERQEIIAKRPPFNRQHNPDHALLRHAYCAVADNAPPELIAGPRQVPLVRMPMMDEGRKIALIAAAGTRFDAPVTASLLPQVPVLRDGQFVGPVRAIHWSGPALVVLFEPRVPTAFSHALATTKYVGSKMRGLRISRIDLDSTVVLRP